MLSNDGRYEIYVVEFKVKDRNDWRRISYDVAWVPTEIYKKNAKAWDAFGASSECWQQTGVHGTYDVEDALKVYINLKQHALPNKNYDYRVMKVVICQESTCLW